ncbi:MAG: hypothetical protein A2189_08085, partial [Paenibacillus sp. RIFOXYA1_FULL_44_5]
MRMLLKRLIFEHVSTKLISMILILLIFSMTLISSLYYFSTSQIIGNHVRASTRQGAKQTADYLSLILTVGTDIGQQIFRNSRLQQAVQLEKQDNLSVDQKFEVMDSIGQTLNNLMYTSSFVRSVYILKESGDSWGSGLFNVSKVKRYTLSEHQWYTDVVHNKVNELWLPLHYDPFSGGGENTEMVLTLVDAFRDLNTRQTLGVIVVNMDGKLILDAIQRIKLGKTGKFFVIDSQGKVMIDADQKMWGKSIAGTALGNRLLNDSMTDMEFEMKENGVSEYVITRQLGSGWMIVGTVPFDEITGDIKALQQRIWIYSGVLLVIAFLIGLLFSQRITLPLKELMRQMKQIEKSNFKARTEIRSRDEIGKLSLRFNQMASVIETLILQVNEVEAKKRKAEIRALRHQINPHFLYNTLSTIRWMIHLHNYEGAYNGIAVLVQLMEASMGKKDAFATIADELDLLGKYMIIQNFRYGSTIKLEVDCDESYRTILIPRMLLQPIVENAFFHGLAPKEHGGTIKLRIERQLHAAVPVLFIWIEDDGVGVAPDKIHSLLQASYESKSGMFGIGL